MFIKDAIFKGFYFLERFLFYNGEFLYPTKSAKIILNLLNYCKNRLLSDGFNMTALRNFLMNSRSHQILYAY